MAETFPPLSPSRLLELLPQQKPFRFVDEILEVSETHIVGRYTFRADEFFYPGHFPGKPVTPGVILLECMCQIGVVLLGIYKVGLELPPEEHSDWLTLFSDAQVEFLKSVLPGDTVTVRGDLEFWRRKKLKSRVEMRLADGTLAATATASGIGVRNVE
ncbi:MAG TPA: beta-hydroxyacyl-ACP dehydratase [Spirochaetia bacterium]|nr:beta-hydroxyacyl-ACP dehydratase [Spirochaetia bacterium]